jgi:hypothetical protein
MKARVEPIADLPPRSTGPARRWRDCWLWDASYVAGFALAPPIFSSLLLLILPVPFWVALMPAAAGLLFVATYGWVGHRVRQCKTALPQSNAIIAEALIVRRPFQSPGVAVLHPDQLELVRIAGETITVPLADIATLSEIRWFNGSRLFWKRGFALDLTNGQRLLVAVPEPFARRLRAALGAKGLAA